MAVELTLILRFEHEEDMPTDADLEEELDCVVVEREEAEV